MDELRHVLRMGFLVWVGVQVAALIALAATMGWFWLQLKEWSAWLSAL